MEIENMGLYDRLNTWPDGAFAIISRTIPNCKDCFIFGQSTNCKYSSKYMFTEKECVVISYNRYGRYFVAWNAQLHNYIHAPEARPLVLTADRPRGGIQSDEVKCVYTYRRTYGYEKIAFIGEDALYEFCVNFDYYLNPNASDVEFKSPALYVTNDEHLGKLETNSPCEYTFTSRSKENVSRLRRDPSFRKRILDKFEHRCIICGCTEDRILEAAHIVDVKYDNDDSTDNGLCFCCNHHKLYDSGLLSIDWDNASFSCSSEAEKSMPWYLVASERNFTLFLPQK